MGRRLVSLQLHFKGDDWCPLPRVQGRLGPFVLAALPTLYPVGHSPGSVGLRRGNKPSSG